MFLVTFLHRWRGTHFPENKRKMIGFKNIQYHYKLCEKRYKLPGVPHSEVVAARKMGSMQKMQVAISKNWGWGEFGYGGGNHIGCSIETEWRKKEQNWREVERWLGQKRGKTWSRSRWGPGWINNHACDELYFRTYFGIRKSPTHPPQEIVLHIMSSSPKISRIPATRKILR